MSLRPSAKTEVRRNRYKVAVDAEEGRRRREDNMVEIRKNKREENLQKKRREGLSASMAFGLAAAQTGQDLSSAKRVCAFFYFTDFIPITSIRSYLFHISNWRLISWLNILNLY